MGKKIRGRLKKELPWDPKKELTKEDWEKMEKDREMTRKMATRAYYFSDLTMAMKILDPKRELSITQEDWEVMEKKREELRREDYW